MNKPNNLDKQYQDLLQDILDRGTVKGDRTGTGTISTFGRQIRHNMKDGFPLLTTKKVPFKLVLTELIWFLKGDTNIKFLVDNGCNIWNGDAYKNYANKSKTIEVWNEDGSMTATSPASHYDFLTIEEFVERIKTDDDFAKKWGELGPVYGKQWRDWQVNELGDGAYGTTNDDGYMKYSFFGHVDIQRIDQIANIIQEIRTNPDSRRLIVSAWNVGEIDDMVLPPCHNFFQFYTRELTLNERMVLAGHDSKWVSPMTVEAWDRDNIPTRAISLMWNQRSVDTFLGLPFNIASYALLLEIVAKEVNMVSEELIGNLGDTHLYSNHIEQAKEQIGREAFELPKLKINDSWKFGSSSPVFADKLELDMFELIDYKSQGVIKAPLSN